MADFVFGWPGYSPNPLVCGWRYVRACKHYVISYVNYARRRKQQLVGNHYAFINDGVYAYSLLTYYGVPEWQIQQLIETGFEPDIKIIGNDGKLKGQDAADPWLYYLCKKSDRRN